ncbi:MAG: PAS domain S-box protein, partial [Solirubrobacteraceae bacterium]|nr:PAS domain S-box protein [Solirubrobacteraceae bacterium]
MLPPRADSGHERAHITEVVDDVAVFWERASELFCVADPAGRFRSVNPAWTRVLGWRPEQLLGHVALEFVHPDDVANTREAWLREQAGATHIDFTNRYRHSDGSWRWLTWSGQMRDGNWYGIGRDISAAHTSQDALKASERRARAVIGALREGLLVISHDGRIDEASERFAEMVGLPRHECIGILPPYPWWPPEELDAHHEVLAAALRDPGGSRELTCMHSSGRRLPTLVDYVAMPTRSGKPAVLAMIRDVSDIVGVRDRLAQAHDAARLTSWEWLTGTTTMHLEGIEDARPAQRTWDMAENARAIKSVYQDELDRLRIETAEGKHPDGYAMDAQTTDELGGFWIEVRGRPMYDPAGNVIGVRGSSQDITARKQAELAALMQADLIDAVDVAVFMQDADSRITSVNDAAVKLFGYSREEFVGKVHDIDFRLIVPGGPTVAEVAPAIAAGASWESNAEFVRKDGTTFPGVLRAKGYLGDDGALRQTAAVIVDLSARHQMEAELRDARDFLATITDRMAEGVVTADAELRISYANASAAQLLQCAPEELVGRPLSEIFVGDLAPLAEAVTTGTSARRDDAAVRRADGHETEVGWSCSPASPGDPDSGGVIVFADNGEQRRRERVLREEVDALHWISRIQDALTHDGFELHAQPIVDCASGETVQHELLIRLRGEDGALIAPGIFLPIAERHGLILDIDRWVIKQAAEL